MGITIHYTFFTEDLMSVVEAVKTVVDEAVRAGYRVERWSIEGRVGYSGFRLRASETHGPEDTKRYLVEKWGGFREERLAEVPDEPPWPWIVVEGEEYTYAEPYFYHGRLAEEVAGRPSRAEGVIVYCETAESFNLLFYTIGRFYVCSDFTKTQPFTADEVEPNLRWHKWICGVLRRLSGLRWRSFYVSDEAGFYETWDEQKLMEMFQVSAQIIYAFSTALDEAAEKLGLRAEVGGGKVDIRRLRKRLEEAREGQEVAEDESYQSTLDEYMEG